MPGHPTPFRFVHTADLHLDSPLKSLASRDAALADAVRTASRTALSRTVDLCIEEQVDALLIAGDLYDGTQRSMHTAAALTREMKRLHDADIPVCIIQGNHDARSHITRELALPPNVLTFDGRGGKHDIGDGRATIHGVSFSKPHAPQSLLPKFRKPVPGSWNIGMLHTSLAGAEGHDAYAPCSLEELVSFGYDYWALGHVHKRHVHHEDAPAVVMPGNPQGRDMGEHGARSVTLVTLAEGEPCSLVEHVVGPARFERLPFDVSDIDEWQLLLSQLDEALEERRQAIDVEHLILRVELHGQSDLAWRIARDRDLLLNLLCETAEGIEGAWIEKVTSAVTVRAASHDVRAGTLTGGMAGELAGELAGGMASGSASTSAGASARKSDEAELSVETATGDTYATLGELGKLIDDELLASPDLRLQVDREVGDFLKKLPKELRHMLGDDEASTQARVNELVREGSTELLLRLGGDAQDDDDPVDATQAR